MWVPTSFLSPLFSSFSLLHHNSKNIVITEQKVLLRSEFDAESPEFWQQNTVPRLDIHGDDLSIPGTSASSDFDDSPFVCTRDCRFWEENATNALLLGLNPVDKHTVTKWAETLDGLCKEAAERVGRNRTHTREGADERHFCG
jgi:hypothetical protein